jgi:hypothetical protein
LFFFEKDNKVSDIIHQREVIMQLKIRISDLFAECFEECGYEYISERRTFDEGSIVESIEQLIDNDIRIGEGDRARLAEIISIDPDFQVILKNEKLTRKSNEGRAREKNFIDNTFAKLFKIWQKRS